MAEDTKNQKKLSLEDIRDKAIEINRIVSQWKPSTEDLEALLALVRAQGSLLVEACDRMTGIEKGLLLANKRLTTTLDETVDRVGALEEAHAAAAPTQTAEGAEAPAEAVNGNGHAQPPSSVLPGMPGTTPGQGGSIIASVTVKP